MKCKLYKLNGAELTREDIKVYVDNTVDRIFAVLITYEECAKNNNFQSYQTYIKRLIVEFEGVHKLLEIEQFVSLVGILEGMANINKLKHDDVKSLVFHCISILKAI